MSSPVDCDRALGVVSYNQSDVKFTIVVAWLVDDVEIVERRRDDLGERHRTRVVQVPRSVTWLLEGSLDDLGKAQEDADKAGLGGKAFAFPLDHKDPHREAERRVLEK